MADVVNRWYGSEVIVALQKGYGENAREAAAYVRDKARLAVGKPNYVTHLVASESGGKRRQKVKGGNASAPGEYPKKVTGEFQRKIKSRVKRRPGGDIEGLVGTSYNLGIWLEFGTKNMKPRPWLMRTIRAHVAAINEIMIGRGAFVARSTTDAGS